MPVIAVTLYPPRHRQGTDPFGWRMVLRGRSTICVTEAQPHNLPSGTALQVTDLFRRLRAVVRPYVRTNVDMSGGDLVAVKAAYDEWARSTAWYER